MCSRQKGGQLERAVSQVKVYSPSSRERESIIGSLRDVLSHDDRIVFAFLYGSFLDEEFFRDIDIGVFIKDTHPLSPLYEFQLGDELHSAIKGGYPVEVRIINKAPVTFLYHVIQGKLLLCRDEDLCAEFMTKVARKYHDIQPVLSRYAKEAYGRPD